MAPIALAALLATFATHVRQAAAAPHQPSSPGSPGITQEQIATAQLRVVWHIDRGDFATADEVNEALLRTLAADLQRHSAPNAVATDRQLTLDELCKLNEDARSLALEARRSYRSGQRQLATGNAHAARLFFRDAIRLWRQATRREDLLLAEMIDACAYAETSMKNYTAAQELLEEELGIQRSVVGEEHPVYAATLNSLGLVHLHLGMPAEAEANLRRSLQIRRRTSGQQSLDCVISLQNMALLADSTGDYRAAEQFAAEAVAIASKLIPQQHPLQILGKAKLASSYAGQGKSAEAEGIYLELIPLIAGPSRSIPADSTAEILENFASVLRNLDRPGDAAQYEAQARALRAEAQREGSPSENRIPSPQ